MSKVPSITTRRSLPIALLRAREAVMLRFRPMLARNDVTEQQWRVLRVLGENERIEAGVLADLACVLPSSLSRIIPALEERHLLASARDSTDGRRTMLSLTPHGRQFLANTLPQSAAVYARIERRFGRRQLSELLDQLEALQVALATEDD